MEKNINFLGIKPNMYSISEDGKVKNIKTGKYLSPAITSSGYKTVGLQLIDSNRKTFYIHRLVALSFIDNPNNYNCINHINRDTLDNNISNLEWCSYSYNNYHRYHTNPIINIYSKHTWSKTDTNGEKNGMSKWTEAQVRKICESVQNGLSYKDALLSANLEVTKNNLYNVSHIIRGHRWKSVSKDYNFNL